jgi:hypothetical protein
MKTEVFVRNDIENVLKAIDIAYASLADQIPARDVTVHRAGFIAALNSVSAAFGISSVDKIPPQIFIERKQITIK